MEATGRCHRSIHQSLHDRGCVVLVINPRHIRNFARAFGELAQTDRIDAATLQRYGRASPELAPVAPHNAFITRLQDLMVIRNRLIDGRTAPRQVRESGVTCVAVAGVELADGFRTTFSRSAPKFVDPNKRSLPGPLVGTPPALRSAPSGRAGSEGVARVDDMAR